MTVFALINTEDIWTDLQYQQESVKQFTKDKAVTLTATSSFIQTHRHMGGAKHYVHLKLGRQMVKIQTKLFVLPLA